MAGTRALLIYVTGDATIDGQLLAIAARPAAGAGGFAGGASDASAPACFGGEGKGAVGTAARPSWVTGVAAGRAT